MYRVLANKREGRILVTGKEKDLELLAEGWDLLLESLDWEEAFEYALEIAGDDVVEWYYDEAVKKKHLAGLVAS
ncbi:hypothetical protein [Pyrobaculum neutrophilum]|uniref:Uncharacterized protein n=1 Tax=Pyrobaculum neutrophilum (strain DSM 2338 / JCM 9278 / NBRC 100436 / V24Sta) TaxID=444157 RepID=B1YD34_PYRNV|nr:hypothetical protein [Pyrobaculum neutrophilum]ACB39697.1 conserved hypothetical protein [Pyrobaculum neutrophilum V24Sta]